MAKGAIPPGPHDERGVLAARILAAARDEFAEHGWAGTAPAPSPAPRAWTRR